MKNKHDLSVKSTPGDKHVQPYVWEMLTRYLKPQMRYSLWVFCAVLVVCLSLSAYARYHQYHQWQKSPDMYFVDGKPMMTTMDAFLWLRYARLYKTGSYDDSPDTLRYYPEGYTKPAFVLLSYLTAKLSVFFDSIDKTGTLLIPIFASLFIIPLFIYFREIGYPTAAVVGSLVGSFNHIYMVRTAIGRVDTDSLNLFFLILVSYFILRVCKSSTERDLYLYTALAGISMLVFHTWYHITMLSEFYLFVLIVSLSINRFPWRKIVKASVIFLIFSADDDVMRGARQLLSEISNKAPSPCSTYSPALFIGTLYLTEIFKNIQFNALPLIDYLLAYTEKTFKFSLSSANSVFTLMYLISMFFMYKTSFNISFTLICLMLLVSCLYFETHDSSILFKIAAITMFVFSLPAAFYVAKYTAASFYDTYLIRLASEAQYNVKAGLMINQSIFSTIEEMQKTPVNVLLSLIFNNPIFSVIGLFFFVIFSIYHIRMLIPLLPMIILGFLTFKGSNRYVMNLAPLVGIGYGYLITMIVKPILDSIKTKDIFKELVVYVFSFLFFLSVLNQTGYAYVPQPSVPADVFRSLSQLKGYLPKDSAILTWWDLGYAVMDLTDAATFHDGGSQNTSRTNFIARGLTSKSPYEMYNIASMLSNPNSKVSGGIINKDMGIDKILDDVKQDNIYLMYTHDLITKFQAIYHLRGAVPDKYAGQTKPLLVPMACQSFVDSILSCSGDTFDLNKGVINNSEKLAKTVFIEKGKVTKEYNYENTSEIFLELFVENGKVYEIYLMKDVFFNSNLNQMYVLGNYDSAIYEETFNAFPSLRVFKLKHHPN
ncbi:MAG: hypothetical protein HQL06_15540 [Nitrospirae bacterium]|nr:hypothetical protein [Nitrospirota bacterium]